MNPSSAWNGEDYHNQGYGVEGDFSHEPDYYANGEAYEGGYEEGNATNNYTEGYSHPQDGDAQNTLAADHDEQPLPEGWVQYWTAEGWPYFYHAATDSSSWERPTEYTLEQNLSNVAEASPYNVNAAEGSPYNAHHTNVGSSSKSNESQHSMTLTYSHSPLPNNTHSVINQNAAHTHTANEDPFTPPSFNLLDLNMDEIYQEDTPTEGAQSGAFSRGIPGLVSSFPTAVTAEQFFSPMPEFSEHIPLSPEEPLLDFETSDAPDLDQDLMNASNNGMESSGTSPVYVPPGYDHAGSRENKDAFNGSNSRYHINVDLQDHLSPVAQDGPVHADFGAQSLYSLPTTPTPAANPLPRTHNYMLDNLEFSPASISEPAFTFSNTDYTHTNHSTVPHTPHNSNTAQANTQVMNNSLYMSPSSPFSGESEIFKCLSESNDNNDQTMIDRSRSGQSVDGYNRSQSNSSIGERLEGGEDHGYIDYPPEPYHNDIHTPHTVTSETTHNTHHTNTSFVTNNSHTGRIFFSRASDLDVAALISDDSGSDAEPDVPVNTSTIYGTNSNAESMHYDSEGEEGNPGDDFMLTYAPPSNPHPSTVYSPQEQVTSADMHHPSYMYSPPPPQTLEPASAEVHVQNVSSMDMAQSPPPTTQPAPTSQIQFASPELVYADIYQNSHQLSPMGGNVSNTDTLQFASPELVYSDIYDNNNLSPIGGDTVSSTNINPYHAGTTDGQSVFQDIDYAVEDPTQAMYAESGFSHPDYDAENAYLRTAEDPYSSEHQQQHHAYNSDDLHHSEGTFGDGVFYEEQIVHQNENNSNNEAHYEISPPHDTTAYTEGTNSGVDIQHRAADVDGYPNNNYYYDNDGDATPGPDPAADPYDWYGNNNNDNTADTNNSNNNNQAYSVELNQAQQPEPLHVLPLEQHTTANYYNNSTDYTNCELPNNVIATAISNDYSNNTTSNVSMDPHEVAWLQYEQLRDSGALDSTPTVTPSNFDLSTVHRENVDYVSSPSDTNCASRESKYAKLRQSLTNKPKGNAHGATSQSKGKGGMQTQQMLHKDESPVVPAVPVPVSPWVECVTGEGDVYYYNTVTEHVQWENPHEVPHVETSADANEADVTAVVDPVAVSAEYSETVYEIPHFSEPVIEAAYPTSAAEPLQDQYNQTYQTQNQYQHYQHQDQQFPVTAASTTISATQSVASSVPSVTRSVTNNTTNNSVSAGVKAAPRKGMVTLNTVAVPSTSTSGGSSNSVSNTYQSRPYTSNTNTYAHSSNTSSVSALSRQALGHSTTSVSVPVAATMSHAASQRRIAAEATGLQYPTNAPAITTRSNVYPQLASVNNPAQATSRYIPYPVQERAQMYEHVNASTYPQLQPSLYSPGREEQVNPTDRNDRNGDSEQEGEESETDSTIHSPLARYMRHMPLGNRASTVSISSLSDNESTDFGYASSAQGSIQGAFVISHGASHGSPNNNNNPRVLSPMYHPSDYSSQANTANDRNRESGEISPLAYPSPYEHPGTLQSPQSDSEVVATPPPAASEEADNASQASSVSQTQRHLEIWDRFFRNAFLVTQQADGQSQQGDEIRLTQAAVTESIRKIRRKAANSRSKGATAVARWPHTLSQRRYTALIDFALRRHAADANSVQATPASETEELKLEEQALLDDHSANGSVTSIDGTLMSMALLAAVLHEDIESAERLLKNGANPSCVDDQIRTPAHYACRVGNVAILALLFDHDAELEATDAAGRTPLHTAAIFGRLEAMDFLLGCAVDSNTTDLAGNAPLHLAARAGFEEGCRLLLNFNASTMTRNLMGMTPLGVAQIMRPQSAALQAVVAMLSSPEQASVSYGEDGNAGYTPSSRAQAAAERPSVRFNVGSGGSDSGGSAEGGAGARGATSHNALSDTMAKSVQNRVDSWRQQAASTGQTTQDSSAMSVQYNTAPYDDRQHARAGSQPAGYGQYEGTEYDNQEPQHHYNDERKVNNDYEQEQEDYHQEDENYNEQQEEEEEEDEEGNSVADLVASSVWGVAASLIDITLSMFSNPTNAKNHSAGKTRQGTQQADPEEDSMGENENYTSRPLRSLSQSHIHTTVTAPIAAAPAVRGSLWNMFGMAGSRSEAVPEREGSSDSLVGLSSAPPTDRELSERGLGFPPSGHSPPPLPPAAPFIPTSPPHHLQPRSGIKIMTPPALVAREIGEHIARSASSTPQRDLPPTPPSEVVVAVALNKAEQMRLHAQQTQRRAPPAASRSMMEDDGPSPPLPLQLHGHGHTHAHSGQSHSGIDAFSGPSAGSLLYSGDDSSLKRSEPMGATSAAAAGTTTSPPTSGNGYSLGASLPRGVQWRYVDVLNNQT
eukprot:gene10387-12146_t